MEPVHWFHAKNRYSPRPAGFLLQFVRKVKNLLVPHWFQLQAASLLGYSVLEPVEPVEPVILFVSKRIPQLAVIEKPVSTYVYYFLLVPLVPLVPMSCKWRGCWVCFGTSE
ncbi:hypothetical protein D9I10_20380 [Escherichia coli]|nr:hypothetical protein [Escherichia coli]